MREECICFISLDINKLLDMFAKNNQTTIPDGGGAGSEFSYVQVVIAASRWM